MKTIIINKGNYSLETPERDQFADARRAAGWEDEYAAYRKAWTDRPAQGIYGEWPLLVDIELSSACNLSCPMCYTITEAFKRRVKRRFIPFDLFCRIVDEIASHVPALRLSLRGEPTLHPKFIECVKYAKDKGIKEVSFLTNAGTLTESLSQALLEAGADWITFSVDGLDATYEGIRHPLKFAETYEKIRRLRMMRDAANLPRPLIKVQGIWSAIEERFESFYELFSQVADQIAFNPLIDYLQNDDLNCVEYEKEFHCPMLYQRLVITSDGQILPCSNDEHCELSLGSIEDKTIYAIWNGQALQSFRAVHEQENGFTRFDTCKRCYLPRQTEDKWYQFESGRRFCVKNYTNRSLIIGQ